MSKSAESQVEEFDVEEMYETEISGEDYAFIIGANGELKSICLPDEIPFKPPKNIARLLKIFGINDIGDISGDETLH